MNISQNEKFCSIFDIVAIIHGYPLSPKIDEYLFRVGEMKVLEKIPLTLVFFLVHFELFVQI